MLTKGNAVFVSAPPPFHADNAPRAPGSTLVAMVPLEIAEPLRLVRPEPFSVLSNARFAGSTLVETMPLARFEALRFVQFCPSLLSALSPRRNVFVSVQVSPAIPVRSASIG